MTEKVFYVKTEYIELQHLLKIMDFTSSGGDAKLYLSMHKVLVNGEHETRRGRKLRPGDLVQIDREVQITVEPGE